MYTVYTAPFNNNDTVSHLQSCFHRVKRVRDTDEYEGSSDYLWREDDVCRKHNVMILLLLFKWKDETPNLCKVKKDQFHKYGLFFKMYSCRRKCFASNGSSGDIPMNNKEARNIIVRLPRCSALARRSLAWRCTDAAIRGIAERKMPTGM